MSESPRQYPRYAVEASVTLRGPDGVVAEGRTDNVSRGGLCAVVDRRLEPGTRVDVAMALIFDVDTVSEPLALSARVVWCTAIGDRHQLGCAFLPIDPDTGAYLGMFLRYLEEGQAAAAGEDEPADEPEDPFAS
jgi:hypothetical protein